MDMTERNFEEKHWHCKHENNNNAKLKFDSSELFNLKLLFIQSEI